MSEVTNDVKTFQRNAKGVRELLSMKFETLAFEGTWYDAFGTPERRGVWMVWGNTGNGKTSFVMQLCKELHHKGYSRTICIPYLHTPYRSAESVRSKIAKSQRASNFMLGSSTPFGIAFGIVFT